MAGLVTAVSRFRSGYTGASKVRALAVHATVAAGVAAVLGPISAMSLSAIRLPAGWTVAVVIAIVVLHASLALVRLAPVAGYGLSCLAMLVIVAAPLGEPTHVGVTGLARVPVLFLPSTPVFLAMLYAVSLRRGRRVSALAIVVATLGVALAAARVGTVVPSGYPVWQYRIYLTFALLLAVVAAWGFGRYRRELLRRESASRAEIARTAILAERSRIARDMHDVVAHSLAVIVRQAEGGAMVAAGSPERAAGVLRTIADVGRDALADMRGLLGVLRGPDPDGVAPTPAGLADLSELLDRVRGTGLPVEVTERGDRHDLGTVGELAAYHLIQEALTNTIKHAGVGATARVLLDWRREELVVEVRDDDVGPGGGARAAVPGSGIGLLGLDERISAVGGRFTADRHNRGFVVRAVLPRRGQGTADVAHAPVGATTSSGAHAPVGTTTSSGANAPSGTNGDGEAATTEGSRDADPGGAGR